MIHRIRLSEYESKVLEFFEQNPEEFLSSSDFRVKFGYANSKNFDIQKLLRFKVLVEAFDKDEFVGFTKGTRQYVKFN